MSPRASKGTLDVGIARASRLAVVPLLLPASSSPRSLWSVSPGGGPQGFSPAQNVARWAALLATLRALVLRGLRVYASGDAETNGSMLLAVTSPRDLGWLASSSVQSGGRRLGWVDVTSYVPIGYALGVPLPRLELRRGLRGLGDEGDGVDVATSGGAQSVVDWGEKATATAEDKAAFGSPGAVPFVEDAWDFDAGTYEVQAGDTLTGIAKSYLGDGSFATLKRISALNSPGNPQGWYSLDRVDVGTPIRMPQEAIDRARRMAAKAQVTGGIDNVKNVALGVEKVVLYPFQSTEGTAIVGAVVAVGVIAGGGYLAYRVLRKKPAQRSNPSRRRRLRRRRR